MNKLAESTLSLRAFGGCFVAAWKLCAQSRKWSIVVRKKHKIRGLVHHNHRNQNRAAQTAAERAAEIPRREGCIVLTWGWREFAALACKSGSSEKQMECKERAKCAATLEI
jgi:hypothetical protein